MPFRFPFQAVFHLRQSIERQEELRLRAANQQVARVRHAVDQIDLSLRQMKVSLSETLAAGTTAAEIRFALSAQTTFSQHRQELLRELSRVEQLRDQQRRIFQKVRQERETFENLRDAQRRAYQRDQDRREQSNLDDLFLLRQAYRRRG